MKFWAYHPDGVVTQPLFELLDDEVPGETILHPEIAADMSDVTALDPRPDVGWTTADGGKTFAAPPAPEVDVSDLASRLVAAATATCDAISQQVVPDETHRTAYANAATIVWGNGGQAPSADPAKSVFAAQANALGLSVDQFVAVVQSVSLVSMQLAAALSAVRGAAAQAKAVADLRTALTAFEASIASVVTALQGAGLTVKVVAPVALTIPGVNA